MGQCELAHGTDTERTEVKLDDPVCSFWKDEVIPYLQRIFLLTDDSISYIS